MNDQRKLWCKSQFHVQLCFRCQIYCDFIHQIYVQCEEFCPDYQSTLTSLQQDVQTTALFEMKQTFNMKIFTGVAVLMIAAIFLLVNIIHDLKTRRFFKLDDKRELEKFLKHSVHQTKYRIFRDNDQLRMISIQDNASDGPDVCLKNSRNIRGTHADMETGSVDFNLIDDENIPHEHIAMVHIHHHQSSISNVIANKSGKIHQHQTDLPMVNTRNIHCDVEMNTNIETSAPIQEFQSHVIRPWFFFKAHNNDVPRWNSILNNALMDKDVWSFRGTPVDKEEGKPTFYLESDKNVAHEHIAVVHHQQSIESIDKNSADDEQSPFLPQDTQPNIRVQHLYDSSGYGIQDDTCTDISVHVSSCMNYNSSLDGVTTLQYARGSSELNDVRSFRSDGNESLYSDPVHGTLCPMLPEDTSSSLTMQTSSSSNISLHSFPPISSQEPSSWNNEPHSPQLHHDIPNCNLEQFLEAINSLPNDNSSYRSFLPDMKSIDELSPDLQHCQETKPKIRMQDQSDTEITQGMSFRLTMSTRNSSEIALSLHSSPPSPEIFLSLHSSPPNYDIHESLLPQRHHDRTNGIIDQFLEAIKRFSGVIHAEFMAGDLIIATDHFSLDQQDQLKEAILQRIKFITGSYLGLRYVH